MGEAAPLALLAGAGLLPRVLARAAREAGRPLVVLALEGLADPGLADEASALHWIGLGDAERGLALLRESGAREAVLAGKVPRARLAGPEASFVPDARARAVLAGLGDRRDASLLSALAAVLEAAGVRLLPQAELAPGLLPAPGRLGATPPPPAALEDAAWGWPLAAELARLDVGQCLVVRDRSVVAVEAAEGTDATIRRAGELAGPGASVLKRARPDQDPRFDLPAVGPGTLESAAAAGAALVAVEAGRSLVLERERTVALADAAGIALLALPAAGPGPDAADDAGGGGGGGSDGGGGGERRVAREGARGVAHPDARGGMEREPCASE